MALTFIPDLTSDIPQKDAKLTQWFTRSSQAEKKDIKYGVNSWNNSV